MKIKINEQNKEVEDSVSLLTLKSRVKPEADIVIVNGAPVSDDRDLAEGDRVVFIKRGEAPDEKELEALLVSRHTPGVHEKVKNACVGIAGLGGLGSAVAVALTRLGIGKLILADFDVVEPSNLNRQQYFIAQIGMRKTEAAMQVLTQINPYVELETHAVRLAAENVPEIYKNVDILVEAFDSPAAKAMLAESFTSAFPDRPLVMASGLAGYYPGSLIKTVKLGKNVYLIGDHVNEAKPGTGLMSPRVGIAAHLEANAVLRLILGEEVC